jgi:hypothetical protein
MDNVQVRSPEETLAELQHWLKQRQDSESEILKRLGNRKDSDRGEYSFHIGRWDDLDNVRRWLTNEETKCLKN